MMDIVEIMKVLPHRFPFLLVDRVIEREEGKRIVAIKNVTINEPFFQGHFPGFPIMPGVLIVEAMAQVAGLMVMSKDSESLPLFASIENVKFKAPIKPGDQIRFEVEMLKIKGNFVRTAGKALVDGKVVAEAEFMCSIVKR